MPRKVNTRHYLPILLAAVPLVLAVTAAPALAGDHAADPIHDFDCDDERDGVQPTAYKTVNGHALAGSITVQYSTDDAITELTQDTDGIAGAPNTTTTSARSSRPSTRTATAAMIWSSAPPGRD